MRWGGFRLAWAVIGVVFVLASVVSSTNGQDGVAKLAGEKLVKDEQKYVQGLRDRGYFDLAQEYVESQLAITNLPADLRASFAFEVGRGLIEEAGLMADLDRRMNLLEKARGKLAEFIESYPNDRLLPEALVQLARVHVEKGHTSLLQANDIKTQDEQGKPVSGTKAERDARLAAARAAFGEGRKAYGQAHTRLKADFDTFPKIIPEGDSRRSARDQAHTALMNEELQRAVADYEEAQTYETGSKEREKLLDDASRQFKDLMDRYRGQLAGLYAQMLRGKSLEEKGELGAAIADYDELMTHTDPALRPLQRKVGHFRIIILGKRKEHPLAVDEATRWLAAYPKERNTEEGLGVQLEMARNLLAQVAAMEDDDEKDQAMRQAVERLTEVVRLPSSSKAEALTLLQQNQGKVSKKAAQVANLAYDDAMSQADTAISTQDWPLAETLLKQAIRKADQAHDTDKLNRARYFLAYVYYATERYYEAATVADHLARRYPEAEQAVRAADLGLAAMTQAYNKYTEVDRQSDLDRLNELGSYTIKTWPETDQADSARLTLGEIALGRGQFGEAATWLESLRPSSPKRSDAMVKAGDAHWRLSRKFKDQGDADGSERESKAALELVSNALKEREAAGALPGDTGRLANINALAEIHRAGGRPAEAVALLAPVAQSLETTVPSKESAPIYTAGLSILLRSYLAAGEPAKATGVMTTLEKIAPSKATLTQLYFELGRSLKAELDTLQKAKNQDAYAKSLDAYKLFLQALAASQVGQSFESLLWAGESMLELKMAKPAAELLTKTIDTYSKDEAFLKQPDSANRLLRARLKLVAALRQGGEPAAARKLVDELIKSNDKVLELVLEKGLVIEEQARAARGNQDQQKYWQESLTHWQKLAQQLKNSKQRKQEGFEAWYHLALAQEGLGKKKEAIGTLKSIMTMSPSVGSPEMKQKYEDLIKRLGN